MKPFYRMTKGFLTLVVKLVYGHKTFGVENFISGPAVIAANHASFLDPELICVSCPEEVYYLANKRLFKNGFFRWLIEKLNAVPISGTTEDLNTFKVIRELLASGKKVVIFPEGIRSYSGSLGHFKRGVGMIALHAKVPIIPLYIAGSYDVWPRSKKYPRLKGKTVCAFGTPILPETFAHLEKKQAQEQMTNALETTLKELEIQLERLPG